jgi:hypothetical protein
MALNLPADLLAMVETAARPVAAPERHRLLDALKAELERHAVLGRALCSVSPVIFKNSISSSQGAARARLFRVRPEFGGLVGDLPEDEDES